MKAKQNHDIPFINKSINNAIGVISNLLQPTTRAATNNTTTCPRVSEVEVQGPRVVNNRNNNSCPRVNKITNNDVRSQRVTKNTNNDTQPPKVLQPRAKMHQQKNSRGTREYRIFEEPNR